MMHAMCDAILHFMTGQIMIGLSVAHPASGQWVSRSCGTWNKVGRG